MLTRSSAWSEIMAGYIKLYCLVNQMYPVYEIITDDIQRCPLRLISHYHGARWKLFFKDLNWRILIQLDRWRWTDPSKSMFLSSKFNDLTEDAINPRNNWINGPVYKSLTQKLTKLMLLTSSGTITQIKGIYN